MVWKQPTVEKMSQWGLHGNVIQFVKNFLLNRKIQVRANGVSSQQRTLQNGTPQGSVLSVTLFLIAINDVIKDLYRPVRSYLYADDLIIYAKGKSQTSLQILLQQSINSVNNWTKKTGFKLSPSKTKCIQFSRKHSAATPILVLDGRPLEFVNEIRHLGMVFDRRLTWGPHIDNLVKSCGKSINLMRVLANRYWGADSSILLRIYQCLIRSKLDYGAISYATASKTNLKKIDAIQSAALRIALGAFRTSPVHSLQCLSGELPLHIRRNQISLSYAISSMATPSNDKLSVKSQRYSVVLANKKFTHLPLYARVSHLLHDLNIFLPAMLPRANSTIPPWTIPLVCIDVSMRQYPKSVSDPAVIQPAFDSLCNKYDTYEFIYTDASKTSNGVGSAIISSDHSLKYRLSLTCSTFTAELYALLSAVKYARRFPLKQFAICTDSLSAIECLQQIYPANPLAQSIKECIGQEPNGGQNMIFIYTPSHKGIVGNETADRLAKEAATDLQIPEEAVSIHTDLIALMKGLCVDKWQNIWSLQHTGLRSIQTSVQRRLPFPEHRWQQVAITRLRIGHTKLTHGYLISKENQPLCETCQTQLTVQHLLINCKKFNNQRTASKTPQVLQEALGEDGEMLKNTLQFLRHTDMLRLL